MKLFKVFCVIACLILASSSYAAHRVENSILNGDLSVVFDNIEESNTQIIDSAPRIWSQPAGDQSGTHASDARPLSQTDLVMDTITMKDRYVRVADGDLNSAYPSVTSEHRTSQTQAPFTAWLLCSVLLGIGGFLSRRN